jgi:hypothetical protein
MGINNLPTTLQSVIQLGYLEREFEQALRAELGFRAIADREPFMAGIGETLTKTRTGLLPAVTTPLAPPANSDITSGLMPQNYGVEQYTLSVNQYAANQMLNVVTARVAIDDLFLNNARTLAEQAARSVDTLAQAAIFGTYMGGNTRVITTLGSAGPIVHVDDIRGFLYTWNAEGQPVSVSAANTVSVTVGADVYTLSAAAADGTNISTAPGGISGNLTFTTSVSVADGTAGNSVVSAVAPVVMRPLNASTNLMAGTTLAISAASDVNSAKLTMQMVLNAKATMKANGVPPVTATGNYIFYADPLQMTGLYSDPAFQFFFRGRPDTSEYRRGLVAEMLGVDIVETNINPVQALSGVGTVRRGILCGQGALVEGVFTREGYASTNQADDDAMIAIVDDIAHITREPLDALKQVVTQTWNYIGGFAVPSDINTNPNTIPTANNSAFKRAIILESL